MNPIGTRPQSPQEVVLAERGEALVADARDGVRPSQMIDRRLGVLLGAGAPGPPVWADALTPRNLS